MCDFDTGFILCTCKGKEKPIVHNKNSRRYKKEHPTASKVYRWYLSTFQRHKSHSEQTMEGLYHLPVADIGKGLTDEWVLLNLNDRNCFDVDYVPQEGDNLVIQDADKQWDYLSFVFQNGSWEIEHYDPFVTIKTLAMKGEVKQVDS